MVRGGSSNTEKQPQNRGIFLERKAFCIWSILVFSSSGIFTYGFDIDVYFCLWNLIIYEL